MKNNDKKKVLLLCPNFKKKGGVAFYNNMLFSNFKSLYLDLNVYHTGKSDEGIIKKRRFLKIFYDLKKTIKLIPGFELIVLNPSLDLKAIVRDGIIHIIAKNIFHKKTVVFFHGWNRVWDNIFQKIGKKLFMAVFNFDKCLVLSSGIRKSLIDIGYDNTKVIKETTTYKKIIEVPKEKKKNNIIFLSRISKGKGGLTSVKIIKELKNEFPDVLLYIVGDGEQLPKIKRYVKENDLKQNIYFAGWLEGEDKNKMLNKSAIMLFPTNYGEGMPISILEGMGAGLAIITRPVAGLKDIIVNDINGYLIKSLEPKDFAIKIKELFMNPKKLSYISVTNRKKAENEYEVLNVVKRIEKIYLDVLNISQ